MRKLLSILGAMTLTATAPLSVIACNNKNKEKPETGGEEETEFDFTKLLNEFISMTTIIFKTELSKNYEEINWMLESAIEEDFLTIEAIKEHEEELNKGDGEYFNQVKEYFNAWIKQETINDELKKMVGENVNFNPLLIDKESPLKNGIIIKNINVKTSSDTAVTLILNFTSQVSFLDSKGERSYQNIEHSVTVNILGQEEEFKLAQKITENYYKAINQTHANEFTFKSNSGNTEKTMKNLSKNEDLKSSITEIIKNIDQGESEIKAEFNTDNLKIQGIEGARSTSASVRSTEGLLFKAEHTDLFLKALQGDEDSYNKIMDQYLGNDPKVYYASPKTQALEKEVDAEVKEHPELSKFINYIYLKYEMSQNYAFNIIKKSSTFEITPEKDQLSIAAFGAEIKDVELKLGTNTFNLEPRSVIIKQETKEENTLAYNDKFLKAAFEVQKGMLEVDYDGSSLIDATLTLKVPESWNLKKNKNKKLKFADYHDELIDTNVIETEATKEFEMTNRILSTDFFNYEMPKNLWINDNNYVFVFFGQDTAINNIYIKNFLFDSTFTNGYSHNFGWRTLEFKGNVRSPKNEADNIEWFNKQKSNIKFKEAE